MISNGDYTGTTSRTCFKNIKPDTGTCNGSVCVNWEDEGKIKQILEAELKLKPKQGWFNPNKILINNKPIVTIVKKRIRKNLQKQYKNNQL